MSRTVPAAIGMMRGICRHAGEAPQGVDSRRRLWKKLSDLSQRYITDRQLPDKSVSLLDTACARVALSQSTTPAQLEDTRREIEHANIAIGIIEREEQVGIDHKEQLEEDERKARSGEEAA